MTDKAWKHAERTVAKVLGGKRNPLSGRMGGHTSGDVYGLPVYVEVKQRNHFAVLTIMAEVEKEAEKEGKPPVLVIHQRGMKKRYYIIEEKMFLDLWRVYHRSQSQASP